MIPDTQMQNKPLIEQLSIHINQLVKLRAILDTEVVRQARFTTADRSGASVLLVGCDYLIENLSALRAVITLK